MAKRSKKRKRKQKLRRRRARIRKASPAAIKSQGLAAFQRKDFSQAIRVWRRLNLGAEPAMRPPLAEAYFRRALVGGVSSDSRRDLKKATDLTSDDGRLWYYLGMAHHWAGDLDEAQAAYSRAAELDFKRAGAGFTHGLATLEQDPQTDLDALEWLSPSVRAALRPIATLLSGDPAAVEAYATARDGLVERLKRLPSRDGRARFWRGLALFASGQMDAAHQELASASAQHLRAGAEAVRAFYAGLAAAATGEASPVQLDRAQTGARKLVPRRMAAVIAQVQLRQIHQHITAGDWNVALTTAEQALAAAPDDQALIAVKLIAANQLASAAAAAGEWDVALRYWETMRDTLKSTRKKVGPLLPILQNIAVACEALERWEAAAEAWNTAMNSLPRRRKKQAVAGSLRSVQTLRAGMRQRILENYKRAGRADRAISHYRKAVKANPEDLDTRLELVVALRANDQVIAARNELQRILALDPRHVEARVQLAEIHQTRGESNAVEQELQRVLEIDPTHAGAREAILDKLMMRGMEQLERGWIEGARATFESALEIAPEDPLPITEMGRIDLIEEEIDSARARFETALASGRPEIFSRVFGCWAGEQNMVEASRILERAETAGHGTPDFYIHTALRCFRPADGPAPSPFDDLLAGPQGKRAQEKPPDQWEMLGHDLLEQAIATGSDGSGKASPAVLRHIVSDFGPMRPDVALEYSRQLVSVVPDDPQVLASHGLLEAMNGETRAAQAALRKAARLARKQGQPGLADEMDNIRRQISHPLFSLLSRMRGLLGSHADFDDDDFYFDDDEDFFD